MNGSVLAMWPTVIYQRDLDDTAALNTALQDEILRREENDASKSFGVVGGRKSSPDLLTWNTPHTLRLGKHIAAACVTLLDLPADRPTPRMRAHAWAVVYRAGGSHELHGHHDAAVSGVYYVAASDDPADGGAIEIYDPRSTLQAREPQTPPGSVHIRPRPGLLIAFPAWALHRVLPVTSSSLRICVAFNVAFGQ